MSLPDDLRAALGPLGCLSGRDVPDAAMSDASATGRARPKLLLRPASVKEVSDAMAICNRHGQSVVPQGGLSGLAGGANPRDSDVALSLARLHGIEDIDTIAGTMVLRAGTILATAQLAAEEAGWILPIDLGARGSAQIGGLLATNAGGLRVIRYGGTRDNVLGLEVVLADGTVLSHMNRSLKDNTGLDLRGLFIGSEGTLGVITRAVLRLHPATARLQTALCSTPGLEAALRLLTRLRRHGGLCAFEAMWPDYFDLNCRLEGRQVFGATPPLAILLELEEDCEVLLEAALGDGLISDAVMAQSLAEARQLWAIREGHRIDAHLPGLLNFDVSLALTDMAEFVANCQTAIRAVQADAFVGFFGHLGDGNLHAVVHLPGADARTRHAVEDTVYRTVQRFAGSVSAEHGIGLLKRDWLGLSRTAEEIAAMRAIKAALDPKTCLNPGKTFGA